MHYHGRKINFSCKLNKFRVPKVCVVQKYISVILNMDVKSTKVSLYNILLLVLVFRMQDILTKNTIGKEAVCTVLVSIPFPKWRYQQARIPCCQCSTNQTANTWQHNPVQENILIVRFNCYFVYGIYSKKSEQCNCVQCLIYHGKNEDASNSLLVW